MWTVHSGTSTFVAGIRALLLQALHPGAMAGVHDWSRYRDDPISRLTGTVRWIICLTYGSREQAAAETARVGRFHSASRARMSLGQARSGRIQRMPRTSSSGSTSRSRTPSSPPTATGAARSLGARMPTSRNGRRPGDSCTSRTPDDRAELQARLEESSNAANSARTNASPMWSPSCGRRPFPGTMGFAYRMLFAAAVATIPPRYRRLLGVRRTWLPVVTGTRIVLWISARALGSGPRAQDFARQRLRRLEASA